jgi:hypothetical protein
VPLYYSIASLAKEKADFYANQPVFFWEKLQLA